MTGSCLLEAVSQDHEEEVVSAIDRFVAGIAKTAYKTEENPWIVRLVDYVRDVATRKPQMKIIGMFYLFIGSVQATYIDMHFARYLLRSPNNRHGARWHMC